MMLNPYQQKASVIIITLCTVFTIAQGQREFPLLTVTPRTTDKYPSGDNLQASLNFVRNATDEIIYGSQCLQPRCGPGEWRRVFYLNASRSDQPCPGQWNLLTRSVRGSPVRGCVGAGRAYRSTFTDDIFMAYSQVCGRIIGEGITSPDAFWQRTQNTIEENYLDGVSVTHGASGSRTHIWSFGAANPAGGGRVARCPCDNSNRNEAPLPPAAVGDNYFCDRADELDPLWTGESCASDNPCCSFHNPPYFSVQLPAATTDRIELRICVNERHSNEVVMVLFAEMYVQ